MQSKIYQTDTTNTTGNCHQAAVASLFGFPLSEIPNFVESEDWRKSFYDFMRSKNIGVVIVPIVNSDALRLFCELNPEMRCYCLLAVRSFKHTDKGHCVVGYYADGRFAVEHDPNPENADRRSDEYELWSVDLFFKIESTSRVHAGEISFPPTIPPDRLRSMSHREFESEYLGGDTREKKPVPVSAPLGLPSHCDKCGAPLDYNAGVFGGASNRDKGFAGLRFCSTKCFEEYKETSEVPARTTVEIEREKIKRQMEFQDRHGE